VAALPVNGEGTYRVRYYASDRVGNIEAEKSVSFGIDLSSPVVTATAVPPANIYGWQNTPVTAVFTGTDTVSGVSYCTPDVVLETEGSSQSVSGYCMDYAGNSSTVTLTLNIDRTAPAITISSPAAGQTFIATRGAIPVLFGVKDNLDPAPAVTARLVQTEDKGSPRGGRPAIISVAAGQAIEPLDIDDGIWRLTVSAADFADNNNAMSGGTFEVVHDMLPPRTAQTIARGASFTAGGITYLTGETWLQLGSVDDLVQAGDGIGLGVKKQVAGLKTESSLVKELVFENPAPKQGEVFASTFTFAASGLPADGIYYLDYNAADVLGNIETIKRSTVALDNTAPRTLPAVSGGAWYENGGVLYIGPAAELELNAVDVSSGGAASGLLLTKYRLDAGNWQVYSGSFTITAEGRHTLEYYSLDRVQNSEQLKTADIAVDNTPPNTVIALGEPEFEAFGLPVITPETMITLTAADPLVNETASGVSGVQYEVAPAGGDQSAARYNYLEPFTLPQGTYGIKYWALDNAGNSEPYKELRLAVSTLHKDALAAVDGLELSGNADIVGTVKSNAVVSLKGNAGILGDVAASTITLSGKARITGQQTSGVTPLLLEPVYLPDIVLTASGTNNNNLVDPKYLVDGRLTVSAQAELTLSTGTYYFKGIELSGGCNVSVNGKVNILTEGEVSISGGSSLNASGPASALNLFVNTESTLTFTGGGSLAAYVYAPYSRLKLSGKALLGGHYFLRSADVSGTGNVIQSGESLPVVVPSQPGGGKGKVSALGAEGAGFGVLSGPDGTFRLGEVYVFPNPALREAAPSFHIETGLADRVKITIYTVSGRLAHEHTITGVPTPIDDGNGLSYAYEYVWRDSIPSGVYLYYIEAQKAGQKLKKTGKFAVVR
jgi:hypothetical protein